MQITARSRCIGVSPFLAGPVLGALLGIGSGTAVAASPASSFPWFLPTAAQEQQSLAIAAAPQHWRLRLDPGVAVPLAIAASPRGSQAGYPRLIERGIAWRTAALAKGAPGGPVSLQVATGPQVPVRLGAKGGFSAAMAPLTEPERPSRPLFRGPVSVGLYADNLTESPDGSSLTNTTSWTLLADVTVKKWKLSADATYRVARGMTPSAAEQQRSGLAGHGGRGSFYQTAGPGDMRLSAERSFALVGTLKLDLLSRITVPTGQRGVQRARGRYELLLDSGLSTKIGKADVWAGAGQRFRTEGFYTSGRDINEFYAGSELALGRATTLRADFLSAQSPVKGGAREYTISGGLSQVLSPEVTLDATLLAFRDAFGRGVQGGVTVRMPMTGF